MAKKAAAGLARGLSATQALREAGYPPATVRHAKAGINKMMRVEMKRIGGKYIQLAKDLTPEDQEMLVRGRLLENVILGTDKGVMSAKQLGADRRISMWQGKSQVGMVILKPPPIPKIDHAVPIIESKFQQERSAMKARSQEEQERHRKKEDVEDDPADLRLSSRR